MRSSIAARPGPTALHGAARSGEDLTYDALLDAAAPHFKRRVARDEVIVYRLRHPTAARVASWREAAWGSSDEPDVGAWGHWAAIDCASCASQAASTRRAVRYSPYHTFSLFFSTRKVSDG